MANIEDVASLAGLSQATVSRVMNNHPYVSEKKKQQVYDAMDKLDYVPNNIAQQLRRQKISTIAVLIPRVSNPFFSKLVEVMENEAANNNFQLIVCQTGTNPDRELVYLDWLKTKQIGGVILASSENRWRVIQDYATFGPLMFCNEYPVQTEAPIIAMNQQYAGYIGTCHLLEKGHRKIAYCSGSNHKTNIYDRKAGFEEALREFDAQMSKDWFFNDVLDTRDGKLVCQQILSLKDRPTAVFTGSDEVAAGIINEAKQQGLKIPEDLAVIGFDNQPIAELVTPGITTIHQPIEKIGIKAMTFMIAWMNKQQMPEEQDRDLPFSLVVRNST